MRLLAGDVLDRFVEYGIPDELVKASGLHLAEVTYRARTEEPSPGSFNQAADIITQGTHDVSEKRRLQQRIHALHYGRPSKPFEATGRRRPGGPGDGSALRVFSGLAEAIRRRRGTVDWTLLADLRDIIDPPLVVGLRIEPHTIKHGEIPHLTDPSKTTKLYRTPGDRLRSAVRTYRRDKGRTGVDDIQALEHELRGLRRRFSARRRPTSPQN